MHTVFFSTRLTKRSIKRESFFGAKTFHWNDNSQFTEKTMQMSDKIKHCSPCNQIYQNNLPTPVSSACETGIFDRRWETGGQHTGRRSPTSVTPEPLNLDLLQGWENISIYWKRRTGKRSYMLKVTGRLFEVVQYKASW